MVEEGQFAANMAQLIEDNVNFIVPAYRYNVRHDERLLIPYIQNHKIGFVNQDAEPIVEPKYDYVSLNDKDESNLIRVGVRFSYGFTRSNGKVQTYDSVKWGLLDTSGNVVLDCEFIYIYVSDDKKIFSLKNHDKGYCVVDREGNVIVPYGKYSIIDGFVKGYARVKKDSKWGIIDTLGKVIVPIEYDEIWSFHGQKALSSTRVIKRGQKELRFYFNSGELRSSRNAMRCHNSKDESYGAHYGEFAGSYAQDVMGYSDELINDAFDGDPDAYWNID